MSRSCCKSSAVRRYEVLQSKNHYFCYGRCIGSKKVGVFLFALFLIIGTSVLFFVFDCPYLYKKLTIAIPIIGGFLFAFVLFVLFRTACTDPGILPRSEKDEVSYNERQVFVSMNGADQEAGASPNHQMINNLQMPRYKEVLIKGKRIKLKYCFTCKIYRPPRASHCGVCDNCVEKFDHHCPWVGNCVGKRNYRFFYLFLVSLSLLCLYILACNVANLVLRTQEKIFSEAIKDTPATLIEAIVCFFSMWSVLCLCGYHTYLISFEVSTNEDIKKSYPHTTHGEGSSNPYDKGNICLNFAHVFCSSLSPSLINLRETIPNKFANEQNLNNTASNNDPVMFSSSTKQIISHNKNYQYNDTKNKDHNFQIHY